VYHRPDEGRYKASGILATDIEAVKPDPVPVEAETVTLAEAAPLGHGNRAERADAGSDDRMFPGCTVNV